jgi:excisionase family DNA binding protein
MKGNTLNANMKRSRLVLLNIDDVAELLGVSVATIYRWRSLGENCPPAFKIGGSVRWSQEAVDDWLEAQMEVAS